VPSDTIVSQHIGIAFCLRISKHPQKQGVFFQVLSDVTGVSSGVPALKFSNECCSL